MVGWPYCQRGYDRFVGTERYTFGISDITFWSIKSARFYLDAFSTEEDVVDAVTFVRLRSPGQFEWIYIRIVGGEGKTWMCQNIGMNLAIAVLKSCLDKCICLRPRYHNSVVVVQIFCLFCPVFY